MEDNGGCYLSSNRKAAILPGFKTLERFPLEAVEGPERRNVIFAECWDTIDKKINAIISSHHDNVIHDILLFISKSTEQLDKLHDTTELADQSELPLQKRKLLELFTAALVAGVNLPDHQLLFERLLVEIREKSSPCVVLLRASECNSGMRATMKSILTQLICPANQAVPDSEEDAPLVTPASPSKDKTPRASKTRPVSSSSDEESPCFKPARAGKYDAVLRSKRKVGRPTASGKGNATSRSTRQVAMSTGSGEDRTRCRWRNISTPSRASKDGPRAGRKTVEPRSPPATKKARRLASDSEEFTTPPSAKKVGRTMSACRTPRSARKKSVKLPRCSMSVLCSWYLETSEAMACRHPVVIVVEDFEEFSPNILQELILSLTPRLPEFPVVLVLGVAMSTSVRTLYHMFPQHVTSCLSISQFHTQQPSLSLAQIITDLGPRALKFLLHQFTHWNSSLTCFSRGLKLAVMEHFHWQPLSLLCSSSTLMATCRLGKMMMNRHFCEAVRSTPSFQRYVESLEPVQRLSLLKKDSALKSEVKELIHSLHAHQRTSYPLLCCLHHLTHCLSGAPLGHKAREILTILHELYSLSLEKNLVEQSEFAAAWTLVSKQSKEQLCASVALCSQQLREATASNADLRCLQDALSVCTDFEQEVKQLDDDGVQGQEYIDSEAQASSSYQETTSDRKMIFHEHLRQINSRRTEPNTFEVLRGTFLSSMLLMFAENLQAPSSLPLHEAFYFDQVDSLQKHLAPAPRTTLQVALTEPQHYLADQERTTEEEGPELPDLCTAYDLYLECGKLINIYDWLQAFVAVVQPDAMEEEESGKKSIDSVLYARFTQSLCELQLLGFIKQTQRKADHVQRLMWGAC